jgi:polyribonucleotide nucleotidyltransferase
VETSAYEVEEEKIVEALEFGHQAIRRVIAKIRELGDRFNIEKRSVEPIAVDTEMQKQMEEKATQGILDALKTEGKLASEKQMKAHRDEVVQALAGEDQGKQAEAKRLFGKLKEKTFRTEILENKRRTDNREFDEIRAISGQVSFLPRTHGSALFTRGETQALVTVTLGTGQDEQRLDDITGESSKAFMLHYNFPPFCVGEASFLRGPSRRSIGHGVLAERAIKPVLPDDASFPYTLRIVSDILESNGSSSMATICGGIMALQDAGVPIRTAIAGVAMGLVKEGDKYAILSDIAGSEDHYGDMDFKVAGSRTGITALQMDIKITGVTSQIMSEALAQAKKGRLHILDKMEEAITEPRPSISGYAPQITTLTIPVSKIGAVIGPGGKNIRGIVEETGVKIDIEDDGTVRIAAVDGEAAQRAIEMVEAITATAEIGKTYMGTVKKVVDFGAFVEIFPGTEGLLHISELSDRHVDDIRKEVRVGDKMLVKVLNVDDQNKIRLSRRAVLDEQQGSQQAQ